jgi:hypothetical protein
METAFESAKQLLSSAARLAYPDQAAKLSVAVDVWESHVRACLQQQRPGRAGWELLAFFSKKLEPVQVKYSAFDRELLACFLGIRHLRYMLEGRAFTIYTDHKPLTIAISRSSDPWTARQCRQLAYMAEYTSDVRHIAGTSNVVADTLSRPSMAVTGVTACQGGKAEQGTVASLTAHAPLEGLCYTVMVAAQGGCPAVTKAVSSLSLRIQRINIAGAEVICNVSRGAARHTVPAAFQWTVFAAVQGLAHPGIRATRRMISRRFEWHSCAAEVSRWYRDCQECQRGMVTRQPAAAIPVPEKRFSHLLNIAHEIHSRDLKILPRTSKESFTLLTPKLSLSSLCVMGKTHM